ncbi:hypothetical protein ACP70R_004056 [Stipagrostis hirtigluma subsp. patula]
MADLVGAGVVVAAGVVLAAAAAGTVGVSAAVAVTVPVIGSTAVLCYGLWPLPRRDVRCGRHVGGKIRLRCQPQCARRLQNV